MLDRFCNQGRKLMYTMLISMALTACHGHQQVKSSGLNQSQIAALQGQGFVVTDDGWELSFAEKLLFESDAYVLSEQSRKSVSRISKALMAVGIAHLRVEGHTDNLGSDAHNVQLSLQRATTVAEAIIKDGMQASGLEVKGLGKSKPVADNATPEGRAENRRVTIIVSSP